MNLISTIKNMITGTPVTSADKDKLLKLAIEKEQQLSDCKDLLERCKSQVGYVLGESIAELTARLNGQRFNSKEFNYERLPDGQE